MENPVSTICGHTFDCKNIVAYNNKNKECPICRKNIEINELIPNYALRRIIENRKEKL